MGICVVGMDVIIAGFPWDGHYYGGKSAVVMMPVNMTCWHWSSKDIMWRKLAMLWFSPDVLLKTCILRAFMSVRMCHIAIINPTASDIRDTWNAHYLGENLDWVQNWSRSLQCQGEFCQFWGWFVRCNCFWQVVVAGEIQSWDCRNNLVFVVWFQVWLGSAIGKWSARKTLKEICIIHCDSKKTWQYTCDHNWKILIESNNFCMSGIRNEFPLQISIYFVILLVTNTSCLNKMCQHIICSMLVKYEPISIQIGKHVLQETLEKLCKNCPPHLKYLLALWSDTLNCQCSTCMCIMSLSRKLEQVTIYCMCGMAGNSCWLMTQLTSG